MARPKLHISVILNRQLNEIIFELIKNCQWDFDRTDGAARLRYAGRISYLRELAIKLQNVCDSIDEKKEI